MTKEELKQEAEESAEKFFGKPTDLVDLDNLRIFKNGYLAGAEPREKRIAELEAQIEKMKCCGNCKYFKFVGESLKGNYQCLKDGDKGKHYRSCNNFENWEIRR